jgi:hypothetical protein
MKRNLRQRRGITVVIAMLFLTLFATLALGFYASVTTSVQVARNDLRGAKALLSAESGLQFMRYHLANVDIPPTSTDVITDLYNDLKADLEGTSNLGANTVGLSGNTIRIPAETGHNICFDAAEGNGFTASITEWNGNIVCNVTGVSGQSSVSKRGVSLDFLRKPIPTTAFDYAVASKGKVLMQKGAVTGITGISSNAIATMMSASGTSGALTVTGGTIGGDINIVGSGLATVTGGSVGGSTIISNILDEGPGGHTHVVSEPDFPVVDTSVFKAYATTNYVSGSTLKNVRIPPNTNPTFTGNATIQGIMYVESPNTVTFRGNTTLQGFIVFENKGTISQNVIDMSGNFSQGPLPTARRVRSAPHDHRYCRPGPDRRAEDVRQRRLRAPRQRDRRHVPEQRQRGYTDRPRDADDARHHHEHRGDVQRQDREVHLDRQEQSAEPGPQLRSVLRPG